MWQLWASETEVFIHSGYLYMPLLFDPHIKAELEFLTGKGARPPRPAAAPLSDNLIQADGRYFIKSLRLDSLVDNCQAVFPEEYERERHRLLKDVLAVTLEYQPPLDAKLETILFDILPHFLRQRRGLRREPVDAASVLALLAAKVPVHFDTKAHMDRLRKQETALRQVLQRLESWHNPPVSSLENRRSGRELTQWFQRALQSTIRASEIRHWRRVLAQGQDLLNLPQPQLAVLLAIADRGDLEVDGFGCRRDKKHPGEYLVYKRTGAYALQDYFARPYLFPDCRVGVSTAGPFHPMVLDMYKHPLLRRFGARQAICLTDYQPAAEFSAATVIKALEEGVSALFYGYNSRKRNGYNSLDTFGRHQSVVDFEDWRIPKDHPKVVGGEVEVKNTVL
jgi:hypothetical protein